MQGKASTEFSIGSWMAPRRCRSPPYVRGVGYSREPPAVPRQSEDSDEAVAYRPRRLSVEHLEDRLTPAWGVPWFDGTSLSLSFVPDGTNISGTPSDPPIVARIDQPTPVASARYSGPTRPGRLRRTSTSGLVSDGGQPMGIAGPPQEDIRFGDIRIGSRPLFSSGDFGTPNMAGAGRVSITTVRRGPETWSFNSRFRFGIGKHPPTCKTTCSSVALHESRSLVRSGRTRPRIRLSVLYRAFIRGSTPGCHPPTYFALQAMYGTRRDDAYEGTLGNETTVTAL